MLQTKNALVEDFNSFSKIVVFIRILTKSDSSTHYVTSSKDTIIVWRENWFRIRNGRHL